MANYPQKNEENGRSKSETDKLIESAKEAGGELWEYTKKNPGKVAMTVLSAIAFFGGN